MRSNVEPRLAKTKQGCSLVPKVPRSPRSYSCLFLPDPVQESPWSLVLLHVALQRKSISALRGKP